MLIDKSTENELQPQTIGRLSMKLKMPYCAQRAEFTCGPACVLMIFKLLEPHRLWPGVSVVGSDLQRGCHQYVESQKRKI